MKKLQLTIVSPEKKLFQGEVNQVTLPGVMGSFTILPQHAPIVSSLTRGKILYVTADGTSQNLEVMGGFVEMNDNNVSVCIN
ncbi:ATP synthase F1 subunit epsilon [Caecibacteroides pullorum]|uniref:ATP synthase F1 subunit epsilon n=1 Tax=Caecibacteroides pullorum TaxID=2725562 RepID=A0AA40ZST5_9BACT|nr:ATP synthase F1 subunit epsilon [Caecibacteroides pullorum]CCX61691.1 aTP synthase F1 epsilon subunit [Bacteroides sp. CAG:598]MBM6856805.1 ATP synthase F1 subunit epsilon [Caecibacteroides pullorum]MBV8039921.1 ATP synthase F1 subunit epsilon [Caecibacteroides pullorum]MBV8057812.1 ATP synthase F1 subunit epsilon [Caecibacteroides pullorum]MDC6279034.1 ATP synthase F1 subunit epsilon [Caecibacteroides pullorum]